MTKLLYRLTFYDEEIQQTVIIYYDDYNYAFGEWQNKEGTLEEVKMQEVSSSIVFI